MSSCCDGVYFVMRVGFIIHWSNFPRSLICRLSVRVTVMLWRYRYCCKEVIQVEVRYKQYVDVWMLQERFSDARFQLGILEVHCDEFS